MERSASKDLVEQREQYRAQIATALQEEPDPLIAYIDFVKWTLNNYTGESLANSGLLELLDEATRQFKDDPEYKGNFEYFKLWSLYASHVEEPALIYAYLLNHKIGLRFAQMYWEYASILERSGR